MSTTNTVPVTGLRTANAITAAIACVALTSMILLVVSVAGTLFDFPTGFVAPAGALLVGLCLVALLVVAATDRLPVRDQPTA